YGVFVLRWAIDKGRRGWRGGRSNSSESGTAWQPDVSERNSITLGKLTPPMLTPDALPSKEQLRAKSSLRKPKLTVAAVWVEAGYLHLSLTCIFPSSCDRSCHRLMHRSC